MIKEDVAKILRTGLALGYYTKKDIVLWADTLINIGDNDFRLIDLSLSERQNVNIVLEILSEIAGLIKTDCKVVKNYFFSVFNKTLKTEPNKWFLVEEQLLKFAEHETDCFIDSEKEFLSMLLDDYSLRKEKLESPMIMPQDLENFIKDYNQFDTFSEELLKYGIKPLFFIKY